MRIKLTDKELNSALKALTIIIDSREQKNESTKAWLDKHNKPYKVKKLDYGDYSCYIPKGTLKGIEHDIIFDKHIVIEKKRNIDEIAMNFSKKDNPRLKSEFAHLKANDTKVFVFVTDHLFDKHLRVGNYRSLYEPQTLYKRLKGFEAEYNTIVRPVAEEYFATELYHTLFYYVRDYLLRKFDIEDAINED